MEQHKVGRRRVSFASFTLLIVLALASSVLAAPTLKEQNAALEQQLAALAQEEATLKQSIDTMLVQKGELDKSLASVQGELDSVNAAISQKDAEIRTAMGSGADVAKSLVGKAGKYSERTLALDMHGLKLAKINDDMARALDLPSLRPQVQLIKDWQVGMNQQVVELRTFVQNERAFLEKFGFDTNVLIRAYEMFRDDIGGPEEASELDIAYWDELLMLLPQNVSKNYQCTRS